MAHKASMNVEPNKGRHGLLEVQVYDGTMRLQCLCGLKFWDEKSRAPNLAMRYFNEHIAYVIEQAAAPKGED